MRATREIVLGLYVLDMAVNNNSTFHPKCTSLIQYFLFHVMHISFIIFIRAMTSNQEPTTTPTTTATTLSTLPTRLSTSEVDSATVNILSTLFVVFVILVVMLFVHSINHGRVFNTIFRRGETTVSSCGEGGDTEICV